jgi:alkylation response protein AidB-like acyl-CoA dehydrogenase
MPLYLLEFPSAARSREALGPLFEDVSRRVRATGGEVLEMQVTADLQRAFVVAECHSQAPLALALRGSQAPLHDIAEVQLVGAEVAAVKATRRGANYLVEWDCPPDLPMDRYLARKREKALLSANVPDVTVLRTYVREDMVTCLSFYDAPDEAAVRRVHEVVSIPITRLTSLTVVRPTTADLFLDPTLQAQVHAFFEPRAAVVDAGQAAIRDGIAFLSRQVLPPPLAGEHPNADLRRVAGTIAAIAWSDMSTAFSLWCHRMVLEYVGQAPAGSPPLDEVRRRLRNVDWLGSTALAPAMAHYVSGAPLPLTWRREGGRIVLNGRVPWASNLFRPDFFQVAAAAHTETGEVIVVGMPGEVAGPCVDAYPALLALQSTASASLTYRDVRLDPAWIITHDFRPFIRAIRPIFLLLQSSFCWGLAQRALAEARTALKGVNESLRGDLDALAAESERLRAFFSHNLDARGAGTPERELVRLRLECARLATATTALEAKVVGGRAYVTTTPTARRLREAAFLPIQAPTEGQLRWELAHSV